MRAWQLNPGFLVDRGPARTAVIDSLREELPEGPWRELHDYVRLDAQGKVERGYDVSVYSIEEELTVTAFGVFGGEFRELTVRTFHGPTYRVRREEVVVLTGLREVVEEATQRFLTGALGEEQRRLGEQAARLQREGEARVDAIPGSKTNPGFGPEYLRAQELLRNRVKSYGAERDRQLLETLGRFPTRSAALDLFVEGCRHAAFDPTVKACTPRGDVEESESLAQTLGDLHRLLLADAEGQEYADALHNAAAFRRAADCIARSRKLLAPPPAGS